MTCPKVPENDKLNTPPLKNKDDLNSYIAKTRQALLQSSELATAGAYGLLQQFKSSKSKADKVKALELYANLHAPLEDFEQNPEVKTKIIKACIEELLKTGNYNARTQLGPYELSQEEINTIIQGVLSHKQTLSIYYVLGVNKNNLATCSTTNSDSEHIGITTSYFPKVEFSDDSNTHYNVDLSVINGQPSLNIYRYEELKDEYKFDADGECNSCGGYGCEVCAGLY